jgi:hypothetical protein
MMLTTLSLLFLRALVGSEDLTKAAVLVQVRGIGWDGPTRVS